MTGSGYKRFFSVNFRHTFYDDLQIPGLKILPSAGTLKTMSAYALFFKQVKSGFLVLIKDNAETKEDIFKNQISLVYSFNIDNPDFENLSDLSGPGKREGVYYFSDKNTTTSGGALSKGENANAADYIHLKPKSFLLQLPGITKGVFDIIRYSDDKTIQTINSSGPGAIQIDLQRYPSGRYLLKSGDDVLYDFYTDNNFFFSKPYGVIEIFNKHTTTTTVALDYSISFRVRETLWKYFIVNRTNTEKSAFDITNGKENMFVITPDSPVTLANGNKAEVFISNKTIPLSQFPLASHLFKLITRVDDNDTDSKIIVDPLPVADTKIIKLDKNDNTKFYSEIYVYI